MTNPVSPSKSPVLIRKVPPSYTFPSLSVPCLNLRNCHRDE